MTSLRMLHGSPGRHAVRPPQLPYLAGNHYFAIALVSAAEFFLEAQRADLGRNQLQPPLAEVLLEFRDHADLRPRPPHHRHHAPGQRWSR